MTDPSTSTLVTPITTSSTTKHLAVHVHKSPDMLKQRPYHSPGYLAKYPGQRKLQALTFSMPLAPNPFALYGNRIYKAGLFKLAFSLTHKSFRTKDILPLGNNIPDNVSSSSIFSSFYNEFLLLLYGGKKQKQMTFHLLSLQ